MFKNSSFTLPFEKIPPQNFSNFMETNEIKSRERSQNNLNLGDKPDKPFVWTAEPNY